MGLISKYFSKPLDNKGVLCYTIVRNEKTIKGKTAMKNFFARRSVKTAIIAVVGFICGLVVDSAIFAINPIVCGIVEAALLAAVYYSLSLKDERRM